MFNRVASKTKSSEKIVDSLRPKPGPVGRERLRHFDGEVSKAKEAVADLEQRVERLEIIVAEADAAHHALQLHIANDGGVSLASYSIGEAVDSDIAKLVMAAETSARAATAA